MQKIGTIIEACERFGVPTEHIPGDVWDVPVFRNGRLRTVFGKAVAGHPQHGRHIQIHKCVFADPEQMRDTLAHEVAHIIAGLRSGHNEVWRTIARALGSSGDRCATLETAKSIGISPPARRPVQTVAECNRCGYVVRRRNRLPRSKTFTHAGCGGRIVPV